MDVWLKWVDIILHSHASRAVGPWLPCVVWRCVFTDFSYIVSVPSFGLGVFFFQDTKDCFPSMTSYRGNTPFVFLSERQPMPVDILPLINRLSKWLTSSFSVHWKNRLIGLAYKKLCGGSVLEFDPFVSDLVLGSSRCGNIFTAFFATLEVDVFFTNDNSCWFSNSACSQFQNWKPGLFLLRTMKRRFQLTIPEIFYICRLF